MEDRIGVFICGCGSNIADVVDIGALAEAAAVQPNVVHVGTFPLWCSEDGRSQMAHAIRTHHIGRVVVAACSPKKHEPTFRAVLSAAGINPFLLQMVNIREQVAWVTSDKVRATEKAVALLSAAIERVRRHEPLEQPEVDCNTDFLVIGAGVAGMTAALTLASKGRHVTLVERDHWIGGKIVAYEDAFPDLECAPCMLEPMMDHVLHDERITLLTGSEVANIKGFFGNFEVTVRTRARYVDPEACMGCGMCYEPCPVTTRNTHDGNLSDRHAIYSPFPGALPNAPAVDADRCLRFQGEECQACQESCPLGAIDFEQQDREQTIPVGAIVVATGFDLFDTNAVANLSPESPDVLNAYQFERMIAREGSTSGEVLTSSGEQPKSIAFIHCAGSRDPRYKPYCSGVCCAYSLKLVHLARHRAEGVHTYQIFSDWCMAGKGYQEFHDRVAGEGTEFIRVANPNDVQVAKNCKGLIVKAGDREIRADMVVLAPAIVPAASAEDLGTLLGLPRDKHGFFSAEHERIHPATTNARGIYIAGCASGPKDIPQSVLQAQAAAGMALHSIVPGEKLELEAAVAHVDEARCGGCRVCVPLCPYQAITVDDESNAASVNGVLCRGCGVCSAACPSGAIGNRQFTTEQVFAEIEGVLR